MPMVYLQILEAIQKMNPPTTITELRRFMGMINQLKKNLKPAFSKLKSSLKVLNKLKWRLVSTPFLFKTDHKPLVLPLGSKQLHQKPSVTHAISIFMHVPGKTLYMADTFLRVSVNSLGTEITSDTEQFIQCVISALTATKDYLEQQF